MKTKLTAWALKTTCPKSPKIHPLNKWNPIIHFEYGGYQNLELEGSLQRAEELGIKRIPLLYRTRALARDMAKLKSNWYSKAIPVKVTVTVEEES